MHNIIKTYIIKHLTGNLGKIIEDEEKIICYVKKRKCKKEAHHYIIRCSGIDKKNIKLAQKYQLNKPIYYIFDGTKFENTMVDIFGYNNCTVIIKNCKFNFELYIRVNGKCTVENTDITCFSRLFISANELEIKDMNIKNHNKNNALEISLGGNKKIDIINSNIGNLREKTNLFISAENEINLFNTKLSGEIVECSAKKINSDTSSSLTSSDKVKLNTEDFKKINITSPTIIYNGNIILNKPGTIIFEKDIDTILIKRKELLELFNRIIKQYEKKYNTLVNELKDTLNNEPISRILKK